MKRNLFEMLFEMVFTWCLFVYYFFNHLLH
jgi:hypothetical protein